MAKYKKNENVRFVNPYNFISASFNGRRGIGRCVDKKVSGVIHCSIITKTPLAILDTANVTKDSNGHPTYKFLRFGSDFCIPGSTIRGAIRSVYETVTKSCFVTMSDEDEILSTRTPATKTYNAGVLIKEGDEWVLYGARRGRADGKIIVENGERRLKGAQEIVSSGSYVTCQFNSHRTENKRGRIITLYTAKEIKYSKSPTDYVLCIGEDSENKKHESVFKIEREKKYEWGKIKESFNRLENTIWFYRDEKVNTKAKEGHTGYKYFEQAKENGCIPIWWKEENGVMHFSMAAIGRYTFNKSVGDLVGENGRPCKSIDRLCPACELFGMAKGDGKGGQIRVTDALSDNADIYPEPIPLKELGSPRPGYYLFYSKGGQDYDVDGANIAGRKFYWHISEAEKNEEIYRESNNNTERNQSCELVKPSAKFKFDVYFDDIDELQLKELLWVLTLGDNKENSSRCHKIGHGKPLGLGSIKVVVESIVNRAYSYDDGYSLICNDLLNYIDGKIPESLDEKIVQELLRICDYTFLKGEVRYPYIENSVSNSAPLKENVLANHVWFSQNKASKYPEKLPEVLSDSLPLFAYSVDSLSSGDFDRTTNGNGYQRKAYSKKETLEIGQIYEVSVFEHNDSGNFAKAKLDSGRIISFFDGGSYDIGDKVSVRYKGNDGKYDLWEQIK